MLTLFRLHDDDLADEVESILQEMCAAYQSVTVLRDALPEGVPALPALNDGDRTVVGRQNLLTYLEQYEELVYDFSRRFTGDYCITDRSGKVC